MRTLIPLSTAAALALAVPGAAAGASPAASDPVAHLVPLTDQDFQDDGRPDPLKVELGRLLFFDKVLSGNRNIACATCHQPALGTSDALPLGLGEGAIGTGTDRHGTADGPLLGRVPRNAQALYNLGAREYASFFHDGRVEHDPGGTWQSGYWSPAREQLPPGLDNLLAAQAMFPVLSPVEMAGHKGENEVATAVALDRLDGPDGAWALLARRLQATAGYVDRFVAAFADVTRAGDITFVHAANAIAAFEATAFRADGSPFDRYLATRDPAVMDAAAFRGMGLFYGVAGCGACHAGPLQTDHDFHAIAMPQVGPGKHHGVDDGYWRSSGFPARLEDWGRYGVTFDPADRFRFRTPSLRNVELSPPYGHAGTHATLEDAVRHHLDPAATLARFAADRVPLPAVARVLEMTGDGSRLVWRPVNPARIADFARRDRWVQSSPRLRGAIAVANELEPGVLDDREVADLVAFLRALTDPRSRDQAALVPAAVPSGLPVPDLSGPD